MKKEITVSDMMKLLHDNGIKIYPKIRLIDNINRFAVTIEDEGLKLYNTSPTMGEYKHTSKTLNEAIETALKSTYERLKEVI